MEVPERGNQTRLIWLIGSNSPKRYVCPLTQDFMRDPVTLLGGKTFEKEAIVAWLNGRLSNRCPIDGSYLLSQVMHPEPALQQEIIAYVDAEPPSCRRATTSRRRFPLHCRIAGGRNRRRKGPTETHGKTPTEPSGWCHARECESFLKKCSDTLSWRRPFHFSDPPLIRR